MVVGEQGPNLNGFKEDFFTSRQLKQTGSKKKKSWQEKLPSDYRVSCTQTFLRVPVRCNRTRKEERVKDTSTTRGNKKKEESWEE